MDFFFFSSCSHFWLSYLLLNDSLLTLEARARLCQVWWPVWSRPCVMVAGFWRTNPISMRLYEYYIFTEHTQGVSKLAHGLNFARFNWVGKVTEVNWDFYTPATQKVKAGWNWKDERKFNKTVLDWSPSHGVTKNCTIRHCDKNSLAVLNKNTVNRQHEGDEVSGVASSLCGTIMLIPFMCAARAA